MKLAFNMMNCGLGNNGGTRTILKCVDTLEDLGHECFILAKDDNFTWFKHKPITTYLPKNLEALITAAAIDLPYTLSAKTDAVKSWYIRAHETWAVPENRLMLSYRNQGFINIFNSKGLYKVAEADKIPNSHVVYQGIDFELWYDMQLRPKNKIRIGCLYTKQPRKRWKDFVSLRNVLGTKDYEYVGFGSSKPKEEFLSEFKCNVDSDELRELYSSCHIWFAPTESEGLHNVPMEAALCGCLVVCSNYPLNGMVYDYAFEDTAMIYDAFNIDIAAELIRNPNWKLIDNMQKTIRNNIQDRKTNMNRLLDILK